MNTCKPLMFMLMAAAVCVMSAGAGAAEEVNVMFAGSYDTAGKAWDVVASSDYTYVADSSNDLVILQIDSPDTSPPFLESSNPVDGSINIPVTLKTISVSSPN